MIREETLRPVTLFPLDRRRLQYSLRYIEGALHGAFIDRVTGNLTDSLLKDFFYDQYKRLSANPHHASAYRDGAEFTEFMVKNVAEQQGLPVPLVTPDIIKDYTKQAQEEAAQYIPYDDPNPDIDTTAYLKWARKIREEPGIGEAMREVTRFRRDKDYLFLGACDMYYPLKAASTQK